ncbi:hypothetical protein CKA32_002817 [Geitlerinema sp. FC II]|nr:hypothetical protein CKA32_002817 [Geitlerinema sp. FC II]
MSLFDLFILNYLSLILEGNFKLLIFFIQLKNICRVKF